MRARGRRGPEVELLEAIVQDLSAANVGVFDRYLAGLVGDVSPADVIADIEAPLED